MISVIGELVAEDAVGEALAVLADSGGLWFRTGFYATEAGWLHELLERGGDADVSPVTLASALLWSANLMCDRISTDDERRLVLDHLESGSRLAICVGDDRLRLRANLFEARIATYLGDDERAIRAGAPGSPWPARSSGSNGRRRCCVGAPWRRNNMARRTGMELAMQALVLAERLGEPSITVRTALVLVSLPSEFAPRVARVPTLEEMLELAREAADVSCEAWVVGRLAYLDVRRGDVTRALEWVSRGLDMAQRNNWWHVAGFCAITSGRRRVVARRVGDRCTAARRSRPRDRDERPGDRPGHVDAYTTEVALVRAEAGARFDQWTSTAAARSWDDNLTAAMTYARNVLATLVSRPQ